MGIFTSEDAKVQAAAVKAGIRTAAQTAEVGLGLAVVGGVIGDATNVIGLNWAVFGGAVGFVALNAVLAGLRSYLSFIAKGIPSAYTSEPPA